MAKSQRSSRKKALRTQRAEKVSATWQAEADAKRLAALAKCVEAEPVPIVSSIPPADDAKEEQQQQRGRSGAAAAAAAAAGEGAAMAVDGEQQQAGKKGKKGKKGVAAATKGVAKKRGKKTSQVRLAAEFSKKRKRMRH